VTVAIAGVLAGWAAYRRRREPRLGRIGAFLDRQWYIQDLYDRAIVTPAKRLAYALAGPVDLGLIDGMVNAVGRELATAGRAARRLQTGYARQYALGVLVGTILIVGYWMLR
jgi:NADH-quinone oxidoreductase subunit L